VSLAPFYPELTVTHVTARADRAGRNSERLLALKFILDDPIQPKRFASRIMLSALASKSTSSAFLALSNASVKFIESAV
jgi:hypothetical protein